MMSLWSRLMPWGGLWDKRHWPRFFSLCISLAFVSLLIIMCMFLLITADGITKESGSKASSSGIDVQVTILFSFSQAGFLLSCLFAFGRITSQQYSSLHKPLRLKHGFSLWFPLPLRAEWCSHIKLVTRYSEVQNLVEFRMFLFWDSWILTRNTPCMIYP